VAISLVTSITQGELLTFDNFNIPDLDYGSWNFGLIVAGIAALFLFLYIMQGKIVDSIVAALMIGVVVSFIAVMFFAGAIGFWSKYLAITIGAPVALASFLKALPSLAKKTTRTTNTPVPKKTNSKNRGVDREEELYG
jgi:hypothetical protein